MPFVTIDINDVIEEKRSNNPEFKKMWDESREEYRLIGEITALRKKNHITQAELAKRTGYKQQAISRIEKRENIPSLQSFCNMADALGYELKLVKKEPKEQHVNT